MLGRIDANLTHNDALWVRYNFGGTYKGDFEPFGATTDETNGGTQRLKDSSIAVDNSYISTRFNLINETRFLYGRRNQDVLAYADGPGVAVPGALFGRATGLPQSRQERIYEIVDNVTLTSGRHQIKFGIDLQHFNTPPRTSAISFACSGS